MNKQITAILDALQPAIDDSETTLVVLRIPPAILKEIKQDTGFNRPSEAVLAFLHKHRGELFPPLNASRNSFYPHYWKEDICKAIGICIAEGDTQITALRSVAEYLKAKHGVEILPYSLLPIYRRYKQQQSVTLDYEGEE